MLVALNSPDLDIYAIFTLSNNFLPILSLFFGRGYTYSIFRKCMFGERVDQPTNIVSGDSMTWHQTFYVFTARRRLEYRPTGEGLEGICSISCLLPSLPPYASAGAVTASQAVVGGEEVMEQWIQWKQKQRWSHQLLLQNISNVCRGATARLLPPRPLSKLMEKRHHLSSHLPDASFKKISQIQMNYWLDGSFILESSEQSV